MIALATAPREGTRSRTFLRQKILRALLGAPGLAPLALMIPGTIQALVTGNGAVPHGSGNDVLGSGGILLLFAMLAITPLRTLTGRQWLVPLRRWYGVVMAVTIFVDAAEASNDTAFNGPVGAKLAAHSFLLTGLLMTLLLVPLAVMGTWNTWSMKQLGTYWKPLQAYGTYAVWVLLGLHLLLLDGFGIERRDQAGPDSLLFGIFHQRFYEYLACSAALVTVRLPFVRRWVSAQRKAGTSWRAWLVLSPLVLLFLLGYAFLVHELLVKGAGAVTLNPVED